MIAINWRSSDSRAYRLDARSNLTGERSSGRGAVLVQAGGRSALKAEIAAS